MRIIKLVVIVLFFTVSCSNNDKKIEVVPVDSTKSFSVLGYCVPAPENSLNVKYAIVNKTIAEANFDYNNINYYYRASKKLDELLAFYSVLKEYKKNTDEETGIEITIQTNDKKEYIAYWNVDGIYYSLFTENDNGIDDLSLILVKNKSIK